ncbi:Opioid growth factor receptor-like protein 1 [Mactra antiquata]
MKFYLQAIREDTRASIRVLKSYDMMLDFYGMFLKNIEDGTVIRCRNYIERYDNLNRSTHNYRRITRILISLGELGYERYQAPWVRFLMEEAIVYKVLPNLNRGCMYHWIDAIKDEEEKKFIYQVYTNLKTNIHQNVSQSLHTYDDRVHGHSVNEFIDSNPCNAEDDRIASAIGLKEESKLANSLYEHSRETDVDACMIPIHGNNDESSGDDGDVDLPSATFNDKENSSLLHVHHMAVAHENKDNVLLDDSSIEQGNGTKLSDGLSNKGMENTVKIDGGVGYCSGGTKELLTFNDKYKLCQFAASYESLGNYKSITAPVVDNAMNTFGVSGTKLTNGSFDTNRDVSAFNVSVYELHDQVVVSTGCDYDENTCPPLAANDDKDCTYQSEYPTDTNGTTENKALVGDSSYALENSENGGLSNDNADVLSSPENEDPEGFYDRKHGSKDYCVSLESRSHTGMNNVDGLCSSYNIQEYLADFGTNSVVGCQKESCINVNLTKGLANETHDKTNFSDSTNNVMEHSQARKTLDGDVEDDGHDDNDFEDNDDDFENDVDCHDKTKQMVQIIQHPNVDLKTQTIV